jgi:hypothetical protein
MSSASSFYPSYSIISAIALGVNTVITFTLPHEFTIGEVISLRVSRQYGTVELNNRQFTVQAITTDTVTLNVDSRNYNAFIASPTDPETLAMAVPSSSGVIPNARPPQTSLIDAFDNIPVT